MSGYGSAASAVLGFVTTVFAVKEQNRQMKALARAAQQEIYAARAEASEIERIAYHRAYAALFDAATVTAIHEETLRRIGQEARYAEGQVIAQTAGSGLAFVGSPVLAAASVAGEAARVAAFDAFKTQTQVKRFDFEVTEELRRAEGAREAYRIGVEGIQAERSAQSAYLQAQTLTGALGSMRTIAGALQSPTVQSGFAALFPQQTTLTPPVLPVVRRTEPQFPQSNL